MRVIDLSHPLRAGTPVYPGDGPVGIEQTSEAGGGGGARVLCGRLSMSVHAGTHLDAPFHFFGEGETVDRLALDRCAGPALLIDLTAAAPGGEIGTGPLERYESRLRDVKRVVLHTGWWRRWGQPDYFAAHPRLSAEAARFLAGAGVGLVGVDMPSVDQAPYPAHLELLGRGVLIVENLTNLPAIGSELFQLVVLPLKIEGGDGSPVRAVAMEVCGPGGEDCGAMPAP
jgi:kynurenine formamidase